MKKLILLILLLFLHTIHVQGKNNDSDFTPNINYYLKYASIYEFHPDYVKISNCYHLPSSKDSTAINTNNYIWNICSCSLYEKEHLYDIQTNSNATLLNQGVYDDFWRGTSYKYYRFIFSSTLSNFYFLSYKTKFLPHLHTLSPLTPGKEFHLGINIKPKAKYKKEYTVLAFSPETKITDLFDFIPTQKINYNGWTLLIYDISDTFQNVAMHVKFILPSKKSSELDLSDLFNNVLTSDLKEKYEQAPATKDLFKLKDQQKNPPSDFVFPLSLKWKININNKIIDQPVIKDGLLYFASREKLFCYNINFGEKIWQLSFDDFLCTKPVIYNNHIYIGCSNYTLYCLDIKTGKIMWQFTAKGPINSPPTIYKKKVYFNSLDGFCYALKAKTGKQIWQKKVSGWETARSNIPSIVSNENLLYCATGDQVYALDPANGKIEWAYNANSKIESSPAIYNNILLIGTTQGILSALDKKTGQLIWTLSYTGEITSDIQLHKNHAYFFTNAGYINCVKLEKNGEISKDIWKYALTPFTSEAKPAISENYIITDSKNGLLFLEPSSGKLLWRYPTSDNVILNTPVFEYPYILYEKNNQLLILSCERN